MITVTRYQAKDGKEFADAAQCAQRDEIIDGFERALAPLGPKVNIPSGSWKQHDPAIVKEVTRQALAVCHHYLPETESFSGSGDNVFCSFLGRLLCDYDAPRSYGRLQCIDSRSGREYDQMYFVLNPERADGKEVR